jgi:diguanylate cyclase (GGDEF)-like protein
VLYINVPTLLGYTAILLCLVSIIMMFAGAFSESRRWFLTCSLPFLMGFFGCALLVNDNLLPNRAALHLGTAFLLAAFGCGWQVVRIFNGRSSVLGWAIGIPAAWLVVSLVIFGPWHLAVEGAITRTLIFTLFNGLCAWEMAKSRSENLPSRPLLWSAVVFFAGFSALRVVLSGYLPMPLGGRPTEVWAVVAYNLASVTQVLLVSALLIALSRERIAMRNQKLSLKDPLTGAFNRRAFDDLAQDLDKSSSTAPVILTVVAFDLDHFKQVNDRFGHDTGDKIIQAAVSTAHKVLRSTDRVFRMGGEEFVCVLPGTTLEQGQWLAERLRRAFEQAGMEAGGHTVRATMSLGLASDITSRATLPDLVNQADLALYNAKRAGRNRVGGPVPSIFDAAQAERTVS